MTNTPDPNYFVCTLGEAARVPEGRPFRDINHLLDEQSKNNPELSAIGFYKVSGEGGEAVFNHEILTFRQICRSVNITAKFLFEVVSASPRETIGLLCESSPDFLFTWLACIRLGHPVLLIAPQCSPSGIAGLCEDCGVSILLTDDKNEQLGRKAAEHDFDRRQWTLRCLRIPIHAVEGLQNGFPLFQNGTPGVTVEATDVAYFHHTSGTCSGKPKPIPQSHRGAVGVLPAFDGNDKATFTTTPLYHGGPADILRAWTSRAMIWLFPSKEVPITASNVVRCLECADGASKSGLAPPVKYFTSVPYVLQMMAYDNPGLKWLQTMELVGVGGSALPQVIGDDLVNRGVNLVSRFGSAECGFLLSSHRAYAEDKYWQYLRLPKDSSQLKFEPLEDKLSELVVLTGWPHLAKNNREDGSYATSDLFEPHPHPHITNAWKYDSRADSQLTLITGKKFDPTSLEDALVAATALIQDALVFGNDRPYPGVLLFRCHECASLVDDDITHALSTVVDELNANNQAHTRLSRSMLIPMPYSENPLEKSSKGTVMRNKAEARYAAAIDRAYESLDSTTARTCPDEELPNSIKDMILEIFESRSWLSETTDLFSFGVDSVAGMQIRQRLRQYLPKDAPRLQATIVEDCGNVKTLADYITKLRHGQCGSNQMTSDDDHKYMLHLVGQFGNFAGTTTVSMPHGLDSCDDQSDTIVLTGASGGLGAHVLSQLRACAKVSKIYCLVRGADLKSARERVDKALKQRRLPLLNSSHDEKAVIIRASLDDTRLGIEECLYDQIARETTIIMHLAWSVNFRMKLRSFVKDNIAGVKNLIGLALASSRSECPKFTFCSSVASVANYAGSPVPESILDDPLLATDLGYSQSKWVAEHICMRASLHARLRGKISIFRVGQLSGDSKTGIWNTKEAWPMMLSTVKLTGSLPDLQDQVLDWLPVDIAAAALIEGAFKHSGGEPMNVFHVLNDNTYPLWRDLLEWLGEQTSFDIVAPAQWVHQLEGKAETESDHNALQLLDHWKKAYGARNVSKQDEPKPKFSMAKSKRELSALRCVEPINKLYFGKIWAWIEANM